MTKSPIILAVLLAAGCVSTEPQAQQPTPMVPAYAPSAASALAFDPPMAIGMPMASFSRDGRSPEAFAGYEEQISVYSYTHQRDEVRIDHDTGSLHRRAYTDRTSVTTR